MSDLKQFEKQIKEIREAYKMIFESDEGKKVLSDLEKRCHFWSTTNVKGCLLYTSPSPRDLSTSRMPSSA